jgi:chemotaxis protein MotB
LQAAADPLLGDIVNLLGVVAHNPIVIQGYTDNVPTDTPQFPSNWYLSTDRANAVLEFMLSRGVNPERLSAQGYASLHPIASNATPVGRALNRRVVIGIQRTSANQSSTTAQAGVAAANAP